MKELIARTPRQLDICLRLLYAENVGFALRVDRTTTGKIIYRIGILADDSMSAELEAKFEILIS